MTLTRTRLAAALALCIIASTITACGEEPIRENGATVLVIGNRQNSAVPQVTKDMQAAVNAGIDRGDVIIMIPVQGDITHATVLVDNQAQCLEANGAKQNKATCDQTRQSLKAMDVLARGLEVTKASREEASLFKALRQAGEELKTFTGPKQIIVMDSGIDTAAPLTMTNLGVIGYAPQTLVDALKNAKEPLPDLAGASVRFAGVGVVAEPQTPLTAAQITQLKELWHAIVKEGKADKIDMGSTDSRAAEPVRANLPRVTVATPPPSPQSEPCSAILFNEGEIGFQSDKADFVDQAGSAGRMKAYADKLRQLGVGVLVTGTTAYQERDPANPLSNARAGAVKSLLVANLVPAERIRTQGVGINWSGYQDPKGDPIKEISMRVVILKPDCV